ncbi:hypothetical protein [Geothrix edaphica]|uniref:Uncharacterized protein n=1 Tax=Geothrix edaphica TaxID=2927976 RepID=A0ABQ5PU02_9BACT|nr:hypothetical protein [Geothrix edaphica]GLH65926.1 hypothetical protein GETHED_02900 [Geothrix edaphica]
MTALILDYFGDWRTRPLVCPTCGWTGTFEEGWTELYEALQDCQCPGEHGSGPRPMLAVLPYPTLQQWQAHAGRLSPGERAYIGQIENGRDRFNRLKLRMASQLPDLPDPVLDLLWDQEAEDLVIRLGAREVWREPVRYEALWRYEQVLALLQAKYGPRLRDLAPTPAAEYHLYGDQTAHPAAVQRLRGRLRQAWEAAGTRQPC